MVYICAAHSPLNKDNTERQHWFTNLIPNSKYTAFIARLAIRPDLTGTVPVRLARPGVPAGH